jgi:hypothetical protein
MKHVAAGALSHQLKPDATAPEHVPASSVEIKMTSIHSDLPLKEESRK